MAQLQDNYLRSIDYLRISITDHCNLHCRYCVPFDGRPKLPMSDILAYEEAYKIVGAAVGLGVTKIRITGGEPLMRRNMVQFCRMLSSLEQVTDLSVTTNGVLLADMAGDLKASGVNRVNVSLDTLDARRYAQITGKDCLGKVLEGIEAAAAAGLTPIKINMVPMRGVNDDELVAMARWTLNAPFDIRFIELMPTSGWAESKHKDLFISVDEIKQKIETIAPLVTIPHIKTWGPATYAHYPGAKGRIGFIAALSHHFCASCNRLRLTADGKLRGCLFSDEEVDIKTPLRQGADLKTLQKIIQSTVASKPKGHALNEADTRPVGGRPMCAIGG